MLEYSMAHFHKTQTKTFIPANEKIKTGET